MAGSSIPAPLYVLAGGVIAALLDWVKEKRKDRLEAIKASGTVETSDSAQLWEEGERLRHFMRDEIERLTVELSTVRTEVAASKDETRIALNELRETHRSAVIDLTAKNKACTDEVETLKQQVAELQRARRTR